MRNLLLGRRTVDEKAESRLLRGTATTHFYSSTVLIRAELSGRLRALALRAIPMARGRGFRCALHASPGAVPGHARAERAERTEAPRAEKLGDRWRGSQTGQSIDRRRACQALGFTIMGT